MTDELAEVIAFHLPQFHPIPENDEWWGPGFTEWTNVRRAVPQYQGHRQPLIPADLGYVDMLDPDTFASQAKLGSDYGVSGFCIYSYWFAGRRVLERPLQLITDHPDITMKFCLCWANENWTRTWDGNETEFLMQQQHSRENDAGFIRDHAELLADPRYIRIDGRPLLLIYRASLLDSPGATADNLRAEAVRLGLPEPFLVMVQSFGLWDPRPHGFDAAVEFPPHAAGNALNIVEPGNPGYPELLRPGKWSGTFMDYSQLIDWAMSKRIPEFEWFRGVIPAWDNTPRRMERASMFLGATPELFGEWAERALQHTYLFSPPGRRLLFVNAWNEWCEGAYLEPDVDLGHARLEALQGAIRRTKGLAAESALAWVSTDGQLNQTGELVTVAQTYMKAAAILGRETLHG